MRLVLASTATLMLMAAGAWAAFHTAPARLSQAGTPGRAGPGLVWRSGTATLRLTDGPCTVEDFVRVLESEGGVSPARAYVVKQGRREFTGCWSQDLDGDVLTMESNREPGSIPLSWFETPTRLLRSTG